MNLQKVYNLKCLNRYNHKSHIFKENVAEHSFFVSLITLELCNILDVSDNVRLQCLTKAILHDMPEIELNDITHDVKLKLNLYPVLKKYEDEYYRKNFPKQMKLMSKNHKNIDLIVNFADILSVKQFSDKEWLSGNKSADIQEIRISVINRIYDLLEELLVQYPEKAYVLKKFMGENNEY